METSCHFESSAAELLFDVQRIPWLLRESTANRIMHLDSLIERGDLLVQYLDEKLTAGTVSKLTLLYGHWVCNFRCPAYCYTRQMQTASLPFPMLQQIIRAGVAMGAQLTYWPGVGELTLLPGFWDIMEWQVQLGLPAVVFTNGSVFVDEHLCDAALGLSCSQLLDKVANMPNVHFYVKVWSTDPGRGRNLTGTRNNDDYPYAEYLDLSCPKAFALLHRMFPDRVGMQFMVVKSNFSDYVQRILPFCLNNDIRLFAEPVILSGNAYDNSEACFEQLTNDQRESIQHTLSSGGSYCARRQFGEMVVVGDKLAPCIAVPPGFEDRITDETGGVRNLSHIYFNSHFISSRKKSAALHGRLCREYWKECHGQVRESAAAV